MRILAAVLAALALAACGRSADVNTREPATPRPPGTASPTDGAAKVPLHLVISNQSFDRPEVDITVFLGGDRVVDQIFTVDQQHNWVTFDLRVEPGEVEVRAVGDEGHVTLTRTLVVPAERWLVLTYWGSQDGQAPRFDLMMRNEPPAFM